MMQISMLLVRHNQGEGFANKAHRMGGVHKLRSWQCSKLPPSSTSFTLCIVVRLPSPVYALPLFYLQEL